MVRVLQTFIFYTGVKVSLLEGIKVFFFHFVSTVSMAAAKFTEQNNLNLRKKLHREQSRGNGWVSVSHDENTSETVSLFVYKLSSSSVTLTRLNVYFIVFISKYDYIVLWICIIICYIFIFRWIFKSGYISQMHKHLMRVLKTYLFHVILAVSTVNVKVSFTDVNSG